VENTDSKFMANELIRARSVLLIDESGASLGEIDTRDARSKAMMAGLDLVQIGLDSRTVIPICKLMDFGKFKYEQSKKKQPKNHSDQIKEVMFKLQTSDHDIDIKKRKVQELIGKEYRVKFGIKLKGREKSQQQSARDVVKSHADSFASIAKYDNISSSADGSIFVTLSSV